jgi:hypothetical protein
MQHCRDSRLNAIQQLSQFALCKLCRRALMYALQAGPVSSAFLNWVTVTNLPILDPFQGENCTMTVASTQIPGETLDKLTETSKACINNLLRYFSTLEHLDLSVASYSSYCKNVNPKIVPTQSYDLCESAEGCCCLGSTL